MRPNKEETVAKYAEEYLKGKSDERREKFWNNTSLNNQYASIMAWRRKMEKGVKKNVEVIGAAVIVKHAAELKNLITKVNDLTDAERERIYSAIDEARQTLDAFNRIRNTREFERLKKEQEDIARRMESLRAEGINE